MAMDQIPLRTKVNLIALAVALVIALCVPLGYGLVAYLYEADLVAFKARLSTARVAKYVYANEKMWQYQKVRLVEIIEVNEPTQAVEQRVFDKTDRLVLVDGAVLARFQLTRGVPITVAGTTVGRVEVIAPLDPLLQRGQADESLFGDGARFALPTRRHLG